MGNKEIAEYLIRCGARVNLFVLSMLGKSEIVIPTFEAYPNLLYAMGPHGFTLLHHVKKGGESNTKLQNFLIEKELTESKYPM